MPKYKCKNGNCGFYADDANEMILHLLEEHTLKKEPEVEAKSETAPKTRHGNTAAEIMDCPDCWGKFERELDRRGKKIVDKEAAKEEKPEKRKRSGEIAL